jgi:hypothetical protein
MKTTQVMTNVVLAAVIGIFVFSGCGGVEQSRTGFLSASGQEPKSSTPGQDPQARGGEGETRLGKIEFEKDYVTEETAAKLRNELKFQAAVQTYLWSFPIANIMGLRNAHRSAGIKNTSIPIFEDYLTPKTVVPTGNQSTIYAYNVLTLGDELMVLVVPPDVVGFISDAWQRPLGDLGRPGPDKGKGGKFLLVPPGYEDELPETGYYVVPCAKKNIWWLVRAFV